MKRRTATMVATTCAALLLSACTSTHPNSSSAIDTGVQNQLRQDLRTLAAAAAAHNTPSARTALAALDADLAAAHAAGKLKDSKLTEIRTEAATVQADLAASSTPPAKPATPIQTPPAPVVTVTTAAPSHGKGHSKSHGNGGGGDGGGGGGGD